MDLHSTLLAVWSSPPWGGAVCPHLVLGGDCVSTAWSFLKRLLRFALLCFLFIASFMAGSLAVGNAMPTDAPSGSGLVSTTAGLLIVALANPFLPIASVRLSHMIETALSTFLFGAIIVWLLHRGASADPHHSTQSMEATC